MPRLLQRHHISAGNSFLVPTTVMHTLPALHFTADTTQSWSLPAPMAPLAAGGQPGQPVQGTGQHRCWCQMLPAIPRQWSQQSLHTVPTTQVNAGHRYPTKPCCHQYTHMSNHTASWPQSWPQSCLATVSYSNSTLLPHTSLHRAAGTPGSQPLHNPITWYTTTNSTLLHSSQ